MPSAKLVRGEQLVGAHCVSLSPAGLRFSAEVVSPRTSMASARSPREYSRSFSVCSRRARDAAARRWPGARLGAVDLGWPGGYIIGPPVARRSHPTGAFELMGR